MNKTWLGFLIFFIPLIIFAVMKFVGKVPRLGNTGRQKSPISWRTQPGSMGSIIGQTIFLFIIILVAAFFGDREVFNSLIRNIFFWIYPLSALIFYVFFPMGDKIPVKVFRAINTGIMIILIPIIIYTTFFNGNSSFNKKDANGKNDPTVSSQNQTPPALPIYKKLLTLNGDWQELETVPQNGFHYRFDLPDTLTEIQTMYLRHPETKKTLTVLGDFSETYMDAPNPGDIPLLVRIVSGEEKKVFLTVIKY